MLQKNSARKVELQSIVQSTSPSEMPFLGRKVFKDESFILSGQHGAHAHVL